VKIITKYVLKEHVGPLVFALSALTSLLLLNYVAKELGRLVGKGLPWTVIAEFLLLSVPFTVAMTLPMAVLVSTLHAFGRMASENEITALKANGMSLRRLMVPVTAAAGVLTLVMVWFNDQVLPRANHRLTTLTGEIARKKPTFALKEQVINEVVQGRLFLRAAHLVSNTNQMRDVTIYDLADPQRRRTIRADSGLLALSADQRDLLLTLYDGNMTELTAQEPERLQRLFFRSDVVKVRGVGNQLERDTTQTVKNDREMSVCELQERVVRAAQARDSAWKSLRRIDQRTAGLVKPSGSPGGLGRVYCAALGSFSMVKTARAAQPPQQAAAVQSPPVDIALQPAPSSGTNNSVLAEAMKMQVQESQRVIDGNQVEIEKKFAIAAACVIFVLLGAPVALRFPRGGVGMTIGVSLAVFGLYYIGLVVGESLARRDYLSPFWAMWAANILLFAVGALLTSRLGSEGATNRGSETSELFARVRQRLFGRRPGAAT
jgi:lipopolysaccharide export system permease protein